MFSSITDRIARGWALLFPNPRYYGWAIVGLSFLASALSSPGQSFAISLYIEEVIASLGATRIEVSSLYGAMTLLAALFLPFVGRLADRTTGRAFLSWNVALLAVAIAFFGAAQNLIMLGAAFFFLRLLGQGAVGLGTLTETVLWFRRYRGRALAVGGLGYAFGELVFPATIMALIAAVGWRESLWLIAAVYLVVFVPIFALVMRRRRPDEPLDGGAGPRLDGEDDQQLAEERSIDIGEAMRTLTFWGMLVCVSVLPLVVTAVIFHQVALFESVGWGAERVPLSFVFFALFGVAMSYITGLVLERVPSRFGVVAGMLVSALALVVAAADGPALVMSLLYGALLGAGSGMLMAANSLVWPDYYGIEALGAIKGVVNGVRNGATAIGPPLVAWLIGPQEQFTSAFWTLGIMSVAAAVVAVWMTPPEVEG
jgi:MFS family permease